MRQKSFPTLLWGHRLRKLRQHLFWVKSRQNSMSCWAITNSSTLQIWSNLPMLHHWEDSFAVSILLCCWPLSGDMSIVFSFWLMLDFDILKSISQWVSRNHPHYRFYQIFALLLFKHLVLTHNKIWAKLLKCMGSKRIECLIDKLVYTNHSSDVKVW